MKAKTLNIFASGMLIASIFTCMSMSKKVLGHSLLRQIDPATTIKFPHTRDFLQKQSRPIGHLGLLGMQRPAIGQIPTYQQPISPRLLWEKHVKVYRPALFRGMLNGSPAISSWSDEYLVKRYGELEVLVEKKFEDRKTEPKRMSIEAFLDQYKQENWYVVSILPNAMKQDVKIPKPLMCSSFRSNLMELNLWIGTKGTSSMLHYDADNILHCLVAGRKDWILIHPRYKVLSDMAQRDPGQQSGFSLLNVSHIDVFNSPDVSDIPWEFASLYAGDCLYLPPGYMHQVRSYNRSISTTFLFYPHEHFNDDDCSGQDLESYASLDKLFVYWDYEKGQETVDMGYKNPLELRSWMLHAYTLLNLTSVSWREFSYVFARIDEGGLLENMPISSFSFKSLDQDSNGLLTYDEIRNTPVETWKDVCRRADYPHGPTKSQMKKDVNLSNGTAQFKARRHSQYVESSHCNDFLQHVLDKYGVDGSISFPQFSDVVTFQLASPAQVFVLIDQNMDGHFTVQELHSVCKEKLKQVFSMRYGLRSIDDDVSPFLPELDSDYDLDDFILPVMKMLRNMKQLIDEGELNDSIDEKAFSAFFERFSIGDVIVHIDTEFLFKVLDRSKKGFISSNDLRDCLEPNEDEKNEELLDVPEGVLKARGHDSVAGVTYYHLFRQLIEVLLFVQDRFIQSEGVPLPPQQDHEEL